MHIPDGFLSPQTCAAAYAVTAPFWVKAWHSLKQQYQTTTAAHVGMAAAFIFLLQMINVPIPGGTSGHAVGTAIVAIGLGPWAAIIATSFALFLQAVVFGDGGLWAFGANSLTMAVVQAWVAWGMWKLIDPGANRKRIGAAAFAAGYVAAVCGALITGTMLGLQPLFHTSSNGDPLYFPLGLEVSIPAMVGSHMLVGIVEGSVTLGAVLALAAMPEFGIGKPAATQRSGWQKLAMGVACMVALVPMGVILPAVMNANTPWGEWSPEQIAAVAGQPEPPAGLRKYSDKYVAPVADYQFGESESLAGESTQYVGAAILGVLLVVLISLPLHKMQQARLRRMRGES